VRSQDLETNTQNSPRIIFRSDIAEERGKVVPTLGEIHRRALEIHIERGDHSWDLDDYLDEWLQADRELQAFRLGEQLLPARCSLGKHSWSRRGGMWMPGINASEIIATVAQTVAQKRADHAQ